MDQISEHQRDLTNSASARTYGEIIVYALSMAKRLTMTMQTLTVDRENIERNLAMTKDLVVAEPLYILLAKHGHPDAHEKVRALTLESGKGGKSILELARADREVAAFMEKFSKAELGYLSKPEHYIGLSVEKTEEVCDYWEKRLKL